MPLIKHTSIKSNRGMDVRVHVILISAADVGQYLASCSGLPERERERDPIDVGWEAGWVSEAAGELG
jgi:hypothetical protein